MALLLRKTTTSLDRFDMRKSSSVYTSKVQFLKDCNDDQMIMMVLNSRLQARNKVKPVSLALGSERRSIMSTKIESI